MPTKPECIAHGYADGALLRFVEREVDLGVYLRVRSEMIDGRRNNTVVERHDGAHCLDSASSQDVYQENQDSVMNRSANHTDA